MEENVKVDNPTKVGYTESNTNRKSVNRLGIVIVAAICIWAALVEGVVRILSVVNAESKLVEADWDQVAAMVGTLLIGSGVIKASQGVNRIMGNVKSNDKK